MGLRVIGAGLSRTGTFSLKLALEQLGVGRCYHMHELFFHPEHAPIWERASAGAKVDWEQLFDGYAAACDAPRALFWRELSEFYPEAKVILTVRSPSEWYESMRATVVEMMRQPHLVPDATAQAMLRTAHRLVLEGFFGGRFDDSREAIARFDAHCAAVQATLAPSSLLIYNGLPWMGPVVRVPPAPSAERPFPRTNDRKGFRTRAGLPSARSTAAPVAELHTTGSPADAGGVPESEFVRNAGNATEPRFTAIFTRARAEPYAMTSAAAQRNAQRHRERDADVDGANRDHSERGISTGNCAIANAAGTKPSMSPSDTLPVIPPTRPVIHSALGPRAPGRRSRITATLVLRRFDEPRDPHPVGASGSRSSNISWSSTAGR